MAKQDVAFADFGGTTIDIGVKNGTLLAEEGLQTAVLVSLYSDKYVPPEQLPQGVEDPRGWWADALAEDQDDRIGSKLWLIDIIGKLNAETKNRMREYTNEALEWMIDKGIASKIEVFTLLVQNQRIEMQVKIYKPNGDNIPFKFLWAGQELKRVA